MDLVGADAALRGPHWELNYGTYDRATMLSKIKDLAEIANGAASSQEIDTSLEFVHRTFDRWEGRSDELIEGDYCFVVPPRISRKSSVYAAEVEPFLPVLRHFPVEMRQRAFVGLPPYLVDRYGYGRQGGLMVYTPVFIDMVDDIGDMTNALDIARRSVADSVAFARRFTGVRVAGLAATLPNLTDMGRAVTARGVVTTTGHAGTVYLIAEIVQQVASATAATGIGVIGLGSIGASFAHLALELNLADTVHLFDTRPLVSGSVTEELGQKFGSHRVHLQPGMEELLAKSQVIVAAVTTPIDLNTVPDDLVAGRVFIDDSQPAAFAFEQVASKGGTLRWVMGSDQTPDRRISRQGIDGRPPYNYGDDCGLTDASTLWGCEAEAAAISIGDRLDLALSRRVEPQDALSIGELWQEVGIAAVPGA